MPPLFNLPPCPLPLAHLFFAPLILLLLLLPLPAAWCPSLSFVRQCPLAVHSCQTLFQPKSSTTALPNVLSASSTGLFKSCLPLPSSPLVFSLRPQLSLRSMTLPSVPPQEPWNSIRRRLYALLSKSILFLSLTITVILTVQFADPGDQVVFHFQQKNHTATQSSFADPCGLKDGGFNSGL